MVSTRCYSCQCCQSCVQFEGNMVQGGVARALSFSLLELGAAQECEGFVGVLGMTPDQLKKEI